MATATITKAEIFGRNRDEDNYSDSPRFYFWVKDGDGSFNVLDELESRHRKPHHLISPKIGEVLDGLGVSGYTPGGERWSQYAGCSCPCSPGFILTGRLDHPVHGPNFDVHVDVSLSNEDQSQVEAAVVSS